MATSCRFQSLEQRDINKETLVEPWPEAGLIVADSPADPAPSLRLEGGRVMELDGRAWETRPKLSRVISLDETRAADYNLSPSQFVEINDRAVYRPLPVILRDLDGARAEREKADVELDRILASRGLNQRESN